MRVVVSLVPLYGVLLLVTALLVASARQQEPRSPWIAFISGSQLYRMNWDGTHIKPMTYGGTSYERPAWSPDGQWLAFVQQGPHVYRMRSSGSQMNNLAPDTPGLAPHWSPDGQWLLFMNPGYDVYRMRADGSALQLILPRRIDTVRLAAFSWSPQGDSFLLSSFRAIGWYLEQILADGSDSAFLMQGSSGKDAAWSPDGEWITYSQYNNGDWSIYRMRPDGSDDQKLIQGLGAKWSPDGQWLLFLAARENRTDLYRMRPDGSQVQNLTQDKSFFINRLNYQWSPDGEWILFDFAPPRRDSKMYMMRADGSALRDISPPHPGGSLATPSPVVSLDWRVSRILLASGLLILSEMGIYIYIAGRVKNRARQKKSEGFS